MTTETTNPYPTIEDKVALFKEHGIAAYDWYEGTYPATRLVSFTGDDATAKQAVAVATEHGLDIIELAQIWRYRDGEPTGESYWHLIFS